MAPPTEASLFREQGFVVLKDVLAKEEVRQLQEETAAQIEAGPDREPRGDFYVGETPDGAPRFFRIQFLTSKAIRNDSMLLTIAQPRVLQLVAELLGSDWAFYGSAMVFKGSDGGPVIKLHRDGPLDRGANEEPLNFNVDIYLDAAMPDSGCLKVIPGSQRIVDATGDVAHGLNHPGLVDVPMRAGDVLFHDTLLLHGSLPTPPGKPVRRVLYNSYKSAGAMLRDGVIAGYPVGRPWIAQNIKLITHALKLRRSAPHLSGEEAFEYAVPSEWRAAVDASPLELRPVQGDLPWEARDPVVHGAAMAMKQREQP